jgi:putative membrane protein
MVFFWALLVGGIVLLLRNSGRWPSQARPTDHESALEILERRFAEGQLTVEDYQNRRRILSTDEDGG